MMIFDNKATRQLVDGPSGKLEIMTLMPEKSKNKIMIVCHPHPLYQGTMNNKVVYTIAKAFDDLGFKSIRFNYRGVGESEGKYDDGIGESEDLLAIVEQVKKELPDDEIYLAGFSFGSGVAARICTNLPEVKALLTVAPSMEHSDFTAFTAIACPWLIVQGEDDEVVSAQAVYDFTEKNSARLQLEKISDCGHFFHGRLTELRRIIVDYFKSESNA